MQQQQTAEVSFLRNQLASDPSNSSNLIRSQQFSHEVPTDEPGSIHLIAFRVLLGLSLCCALFSFAVFLVH